MEPWQINFCLVCLSLYMTLLYIYLMVSTSTPHAILRFGFSFTIVNPYKHSFLWLSSAAWVGWSFKALWRACELHKFSHQNSDSYAILKKQHIDSLSCIADDYGAVVVCLGANVTKLPELSDKLPITHCRGVVLHLDLPCDRKGQYAFNGPSVVGDTWLAARGSCKLIVGATKEWDNSNTSPTVTDAEARIAADEMVTKAAAFYPPIRNWHFREACAGVRAMTPRTPYGKIPLVGCIDDIIRGSYPRKVISPRFWIFGGLGSRGLIYHGWLGKKLAEAVVTQSEACLPCELLQWKHDKQLVNIT